VRKFALGVGVLVGIACSSSHPPGLSEYTPTPEAGTSAGPLNLTPVVSPNDDPTTCAQAAMLRSYVGCDYWPTVVANPVWSVFDFAVVVANAGTAAADVTVTGPGGVHVAQTVEPNTLAKIYLPWVASLKGDDCDVCGVAPSLSASVLAPKSAYHLVSSVPVSVYQFNALEYQPVGGPAGKDWSSCPGNQVCSDLANPRPIGCFSYTNDSSLLLPSTALTGHYRVTGYPGQTVPGGDAGTTDTMGGYFAITGTVDGTTVKVQLSPTAHILAGGGVADTPGGGVLTLSLDAGDVVELAGALGEKVDVSGSLVAADQPVQVIAGAPCMEIPGGSQACDHLEQSVFPAETLGKHYFVPAPTGPNVTPVARVVRLYGNVDGTTLSYAPSMPSGCPATLGAGQVADCGMVQGDFEVTGSNEFGVGSFQLGGTLVDTNRRLGDPSESLMAAVEQYRTKYVFLAPTDYEENFADIVFPFGAAMVLDGVGLVTRNAKPIAGGYGIIRVSLNRVNVAGHGAHVLEASAPVGLQVIGYGDYTSYQYPGGLNLKQIAPPPPDPK
jgi:hypothetical protein